jgi:histidine ammonia-lyase
MSSIEFNGERRTIEEIVQIAEQTAKVSLSTEKAFSDKINSGAKFLDEALAAKGSIYGVTTGYGDSCGKNVPQENYNNLPVHLTRFHGCGMGDFFNEATTRSIIASRLQSLSL